MKISYSFALVLVLVALAFGLMADALFHDAMLGINVPLATFIFVGLAYLAASRNPIPLTGGGRWLAVPVLALLAVFALRGSVNMLFICATLAVCLAGVGMMRALRGRARVAGFLPYAIDVMLAGIYTLVGWFVILMSKPWKALAFRGSRAVPRVIIGVCMAIPLLLVFGSLFASADTTFKKLVNDLFNFKLDKIISHALAVVVWAFLAMGFLYAIFGNDQNTETMIKPPAAPHFVETATMLALMNILFAVFVILQFPYLFSLNPIGATPGLDPYADYARRGFFELVAVAVLLLPVLLMADWLMTNDSATHRRIGHILSLALVAQMGVIVASALQRMALYARAFGLTELRLYTTAVMIGLALMFVWLVITVLRNQRERFAFGALVCAVSVALALAVLNPDYQIARFNLTQHSKDVLKEQRTGLDTVYLSTLSADAVPAMLEALPNLEPAQSCKLAGKLLANWAYKPAQDDWRSYNFGRASAAAQIKEWTPFLQSISCE